ncbi:hypothetical protein JJ728_23195, partial [Salmonella enterica subsp. enterica serovar Typhi]|uniref:hypothetical protein n=1 Tax=Salmonella enterica TaxID=28901 RepID=UPI0019168D67
MFTPSNVEMMKAHLYILRNSEEVAPYVTDHMRSIRTSYPAWTDQHVLNEHIRTFVYWFGSAVMGKAVSETLKWLAFRPSPAVRAFSCYDINGYSFATKRQDEKSTTQNSGVTLISEALHVSSRKDKNPLYANMAYYGVIEDIWELDYVCFQVAVFRCKWV